MRFNISDFLPPELMSISNRMIGLPSEAKLELARRFRLRAYQTESALFHARAMDLIDETKRSHEIADGRLPLAVFIGRAASYDVVIRGGASPDGPYLLRPGCFRPRFSGAGVTLLPGHRDAANHENVQAFASTSAKTLTLTDEPDGLHFTAMVRDRLARRIAADVRDGSRSGCSVRFIRLRSHTEMIEGEAVDVVEGAELQHIAVIDKPADATTFVNAFLGKER